jgi:hypothetical protein
MSASRFKTIIATSLSRLLQPCGFRKRGFYVIRRVNDVVQLLQLQSSSKSTVSRAIVTVNVGVLSETLETARGRTVTTPTWPDCHWRERIGHLAPAKTDLWWDIDSESAAVSCAAEITALVHDHVLPVLEVLDTTAGLVALWRSGQSPGLTARQRQEYQGILASHRVPD